MNQTSKTNDYVVSTTYTLSYILEIFVKRDNDKVDKIYYELKEQTEESIYELYTLFNIIEKQFPNVKIWVRKFSETDIYGNREKIYQLYGNTKINDDIARLPECDVKEFIRVFSDIENKQDDCVDPPIGQF